MYTTSHFIWISLYSKYFADIFSWIQYILWPDCSSIIELQNPLSLHITIFYLPRDISPQDKEVIHKILWQMWEVRLDFSISNMKYFWEWENLRVGYIGIQNDIQLRMFHTSCKKLFPEYIDIPDNAYPIFTPHITLFRVKDIPAFLEKKWVIEQFIAHELVSIQNFNLVEGWRLFAVNSRFTPELQIIIS